MRCLFYDYNLLGDSLQTTPALRAFYKEFAQNEKNLPLTITIAAHDNYVSDIFNRLGDDVPIEVFTGKKEDLDEHSFDFVFNFDISKAFSIGVASNTPACLVFCQMLGVTPERGYPFFFYKAPFVLKEPTYLLEDFEKPVTNFILLQPYSVSCSSWSNEKANKRMPDECWAAIYSWLKRDYPQFHVRVLGSEKDYIIPGISEDDHRMGLSLDEVAYRQRNARLVISLDSGVAHLAASQDARMIELYPECLPSQWMSNSESPNVRIIHAVPWELDEAWVYEQVKDYLQEIEKCHSTVTVSSR